MKQLGSVFWCKTAHMVHKMHTGWQESNGWFHDIAGEKFALEQSADVNRWNQRTTQWRGEQKANILRWLVGVNCVGSFCAFVGQFKKCPWLNFRLVMLMETVQAQQMRSVPTEVVCVWMIVYINGCICNIHLPVGKYSMCAQCVLKWSSRYLTVYVSAQNGCLCACMYVFYL